MRATRSRSPRQFGFAWLIWLALWLPVAQAAASWHAYSHAAADAVGRGGDKQAPHAAHCDLCLAAAAIGDGAPVGAPPQLPAPDARHQRPGLAVADLWPAPTTPSYQSRAPPSAPR